MMSSSPLTGEQTATASRVGADLRAARERLSWTLPAMSAHLRIRLPYLEAIEDGRIADLPGNAYAVGFVRTYAGALGLAPDEIARRFRAEAADINRKTELTFPAPVPERGVPAGVVVLFGAVLAVGAYVGWYQMSGDAKPLSDAVQPVPDRLVPLAGTTAPTIAPATPAAAPTATAAASPTSLPPAAISPSSAAAAGAPPPSIPTPAPAVAPPPAQLALAAPVAPPAADGGRIMLRAKADSWVQVRDKAGPVLLNRVMRNGDTWPVPNKGQLLLTTGNAGGTELLVDGVVAPSLGSDGAVRRDLLLDPDQIRDGKLAPPAAPAKPVTRQP